MLAALLDVDLLDEFEFLDLDQADPRNIMRWLRLVQLAKRANYNGCILRSDLRPFSATELACHTRQREMLDDWLAFLDLATSLGLLRVEPKTGSFQIVHWGRWHKPPSKQSEAERARKRKHRDEARLRDIADTAEDPLSPNFPQLSADVRSVPQCPHTNTITITNTNVPLLGQPAVQTNAESGENTANEGRPDGPSLNGYGVSQPSVTRIAGHATVSAAANRYLEPIRASFPAYMPGVYDGDQLTKAALDLCSRKSRWDQHFTEGDFLDGLRLAAETAKRASIDGETIKLLIPWIIKVASTQYFEQTHEWRQMNAQRATRGQPPIPPLKATEPTKARKAVGK